MKKFVFEKILVNQGKFMFRDTRRGYVSSSKRLLNSPTKRRLIFTHVHDVLSQKILNFTFRIAVSGAEKSSHLPSFYFRPETMSSLCGFFIFKFLEHWTMKTLEKLSGSSYTIVRTTLNLTFPYQHDLLCVIFQLITVPLRTFM